MGDTESFPWKTQRSQPNPARKSPLDGYNRKPIKYSEKGRDVPYYGLGALAYVLGRKTATLRDWEEKGWIPVPPKVFGSSDPDDPVTFKHGQRRLYPEDLILGIWEIARQEGVLNKHQIIKETQFVQRVRQLFREFGGAQAQLSRSYTGTEHQKDRA